MNCPICQGTGTIKAPLVPRTKYLKPMIRCLRDNGFSIRQIMKLTKYKSPLSIQRYLRS